MEYQSELIERCASCFLIELPGADLVIACSAAFQDIIANITGSEGDGPIRTYIHKVRTMLVLYLPTHSTIDYVYMDRYILGLRFKMLTGK